MIYKICIPVVCHEVYTVEADSREKAIKSIRFGEFKTVSVSIGPSNYNPEEWVIVSSDPASS